MGIIELEREYCKSISNQPKLLENHYTKILSEIEPEASNKVITKAILMRMREYYITQKKVSNFLGINVNPPQAYNFEQTVLFYLKAYIEKKRKGWKVYSNENIGEKGNTLRPLRPDISIFDNSNKLIAAIECKLQLGYNRYNWEEKFKKREADILEKYPKAKVFLLVLTEENWDGFRGNSNERKKYFCLTEKWPTKLPEDISDKCILNPIEELLEQL